MVGRRLEDEVYHRTIHSGAKGRRRSAKSWYVTNDEIAKRPGKREMSGQERRLQADWELDIKVQDAKPAESVCDSWRCALSTSDSCKESDSRGAEG